MTNSGTSVVFYLDGVQMTDPAISVNLAGSFYMELGRQASIIVDELYVYSTVLTPATITSRFQSLEWCLPGSCPSGKTCTPVLTGNTCA